MTLKIGVFVIICEKVIDNLLTTCQLKFFRWRTFAPEIKQKEELSMEIITIESGIWQELTERIKNIERYVKDTAQPGTISDEELWVDNDQAMRILCVAKRTLQQYRSDGKLPYKRFGRQIRYRLSDIEAFSGMSLKTLSQKNLTSVRKECLAQNRQIINHQED